MFKPAQAGFFRRLESVRQPEKTCFTRWQSFYCLDAAVKQHRPYS
ncbi:hypothetical protein HMPREF9123_0095 [Neisseria bacilliformis ATCC BAA-1200]|uniref:Uncharacterized protein n=1 Tax=Neisseria bacilliformis ATCC BAA-1200 TaxID=888742 RepID=F2B8P2_9NEIS|nr:hypothetical protein HMPREF9123_0095 [Neisseria bacilliformis ATCC BAA-1200]